MLNGFDAQHLPGFNSQLHVQQADAKQQVDGNSLASGPKSGAFSKTCTRPPTPARDAAGSPTARKMSATATPSAGGTTAAAGITTGTADPVEKGPRRRLTPARVSLGDRMPSPTRTSCASRSSFTRPITTKPSRPTSPSTPSTRHPLMRRVTRRTTPHSRSTNTSMRSSSPNPPTRASLNCWTITRGQRAGRRR